MARKLTYLSLDKLDSLVGQVRTINRTGVSGDIYEFGVALGGASIIMASLMGDRRFHGYDVFGMIPAPTEEDEDDSHERYRVIASGKSQGIGGNGEYYGYKDNLYNEVVTNFQSFDLTVDQITISLHRGLFEETLSLDETDRVALAHVDCDWYRPVKFCINEIAPRLSDGGVMIIDDINDYEGCRKAVNEFLEHNPDFRLITQRPHGIIARIGIS